MALTWALARRAGLPKDEAPDQHGGTFGTHSLRIVPKGTPGRTALTPAPIRIDGGRPHTWIRASADRLRYLAHLVEGTRPAFLRKRRRLPGPPGEPPRTQRLAELAERQVEHSRCQKAPDAVGKAVGDHACRNGTCLPGDRTKEHSG
jgi:hypothetical protein